MEEFTFPSFPLEQYNAKKVPFPQFASASPWLIVPGGVVDTAVHEHDHRRSLSAVEPQEAAGSDYRHQHQQQLGGYDHHRHGSARFAVEDKMDMLWEDFNEELASVPPLCPLSPVINKGALAMKEAAGWLGGDGDGDTVVVDPEKHGKHPRPQPQDGRVVRRRKWSLRLMLRLLKKLFLVKKSRNPRTAPAPI